MLCSNCGRFIEEGKAFCRACGSPAPESSGVTASPIPPPTPAWRPPTGPSARRSRTGLVVGIAAALVVLWAGAGVSAYFAFFQNEGSTATTTVTLTSSSATGGEVSSSGAATTSTATAVSSDTTTRTAPGSTVSASGPPPTLDPTRGYLLAADDLVAELASDDDRIPELAAEINDTAPHIPVWVRDELSAMLGSLDALNVELASLDVPAGFDDSHFWLGEAVFDMAGRIEATIQGIEAIWDLGAMSATASGFFDEGRTDRDSYRAAMEEYYGYLPGG